MKNAFHTLLDRFFLTEKTNEISKEKIFKNKKIFLKKNDRFRIMKFLSNSSAPKVKFENSLEDELPRSCKEPL